MVLITLALVFTQLSVLAFGGGNAILPEMQHQVVNIHHWMSAEQFSSLFAMAQAAPGPNMMIVPLIGWHVAGPAGLLVTSIAKFGPSSMITVYALKFWQRFKNHPFRSRFEQALKPITVGLVLVSAWMIA
ncbi:chromate transporter, partial [Acinetobacter sp. Colony158]